MDSLIIGLDAMAGSDLAAVPAERFAVGDAPDTAIRVSLGGMLERDALQRALRTLAGYIALGDTTRMLLV